MTLQGLIDYFRKQVSDEAAPYLWDDTESLLFAIDAQDMFVRKIGGISCNTVAAASDPSNLQLHDLVLTANTPYTAFSPYILRIRSGKLLTAKLGVEFISEYEVPRSSIQSHDYDNTVRVPYYLDDTDTGVVSKAIIGIVDKQVRWFKVPNSSDTCRLHVYRLPYPRITDQDSALEIEEQHHIHLVKWMKHMAYAKEDAETYDKDLSERNEKAFMAYCDDAKAELDRQRFKPRIVRYGGL